MEEISDFFTKNKFFSENYFSKLMYPNMGQPPSVGLHLLALISVSHLKFKKKNEEKSVKKWVVFYKKRREKINYLKRRGKMALLKKKKKFKLKPGTVRVCGDALIN